MSPAFEFAVRIYYEDTDAGGVVYHANYLRFFERARSEWLLHLGLDHQGLEREHHLLFVVRSARIDYLRPARLGDMIMIDVGLLRARRSTLTFAQHLRRAGELLATLEVAVVSIDSRSFRPCSLPDPFRQAIAPWLPAAAAA